MVDANEGNVGSFTNEYLNSSHLCCSSSHKQQGSACPDCKTGHNKCLDLVPSGRACLNPGMSAAKRDCHWL